MTMTTIRRTITGIALVACAFLGACGERATSIAIINTADQSVGVEITALNGGTTTLEVPSGMSSTLTRGDVAASPLGSVDQGVTITVSPEAGQPMAMEMDAPGPYYLRVTGAGGFIRLTRDEPREVDPFDRADPSRDPRRSQPGFTPAQRAY